jgi:RNA polymerase sigma-54 factor
MLKQSIQIKLGQSLTMTPQLQQAIKLLQLSTLELQQQIQEALEENPMLEIAEDQEEVEEENALDNGNGLDTEQTSTETAEIDFPDEADVPTSSELQQDKDIPDELPVDTDWDQIYDMPGSGLLSSGPADDNRDFYENQSSGSESLQEHLLWQLNLTPLSDTDRAIANSLIDALDEDGYLNDELDNFLSSFTGDEPPEIEEWEAVLHLIQHLDPLGCGSRNLSECLLIQLQQLPEDTSGLETARNLSKDFLDLLGNHDYKQLLRSLRVKEDELKKAVELIQSLNPRPGSNISTRTAEYVIPDVYVRKQKGKWVVELNPDVAPKLQVNALYASYIKRADQSADNTFLRNNLQEARWFIKSLLSRNETLLRVATAIVEHQRPFLEYGEEAMKPLILREIAEQLEMHESTISRVTTQKFMHTPRGVFEFKYFFSSHVATADGGECSATAIRAMIRKLVEAENQTKPLSDNKIASILVERGINVARRTVAKYREAMAIPPSNERKRLA